MSVFRTGMLRACGRFIGCATAYALLINLFLAGILGAQYATNAHGEAGFAICLNGSDGVPADTSGNTPSHAAKIHCALCTVGGQLADADAPAVTVPVAQVFQTVAPVFAGDAPAISVRHSSTSPRGPPQTA